MPLLDPPTNPFPSLPGYILSEQLYASSKTLIYRGLQRASQRPVVIKMLRQAYPLFNEIVQFRHQYAITQNLDIPGILRPLSLEPWENAYALILDDDGSISLAQYIQEQPLDLPTALKIGLQLAEILHQLHAHRVIHKDIKPSNILIHPQTKHLQLIDFSISSLLAKETQPFQNPNVLAGTLAYLAPEQTGRMNRAIDYRSDFYSLGVTLYQLLTGELPFQAEEPLALVRAHIAQAPLSPAQLNPKIPTLVASIVLKLMAKNAEERYQSALGLKYDLEECLRQWQESGTIAEFELAQQDRYAPQSGSLQARFIIPEKLYGREAEVAELLAAFERVVQGSSEFILVAGDSGIGKTTLIQEIYKPITAYNGCFIKGTYDPLNRNIPFSAFRQAFGDLIEQLLLESDTNLAIWRQKIHQALGENSRVLIDTIPGLERLLGTQSSLPERAETAAQPRVTLLLQKFLALFSSTERPLTLFLDNLQWADSDSLQLIERLLENQKYLLILGAYRDREISLPNPLFSTVQRLKNAHKAVKTLALSPLTPDEIEQFVTDTLYGFRKSPSETLRARAQPLAEFIFEQTHGNPFFAARLLEALAEDGKIAFNSNRGTWESEIDRVKAIDLTENVVKFMGRRLQKLPLNTKELMEVGACLGNSFDLETLALVTQKSPAELAVNLWPALERGLLLPENEAYKFYLDRDAIEEEFPLTEKVAYRFLHDLVRQAAYSLIPERQKAATHLKMARLLQQRTPCPQRPNNLFNAPTRQLASLLLAAGTRIHRQAHLKETISILREAYQSGIEGQNWEDLGEIALILSQYSYCLGWKLASLEGEMVSRIATLTRVKQERSLRQIKTVRQCILNLQYPSENPACLRETVQREAETIFQLKEDKDNRALATFYLFKTMLAYLFERKQEALETARKSEQYLAAVADYYFVPLFYFYDSLVHLALDASLPLSEREIARSRVIQNQEKLQNFANSVPLNFQHKFDLVEAQRQFILGKPQLALDLYDRAIDGAKANQYLQEEALANELAARFYLAWGKEKVAAGYMQEAHSAYARWGAAAKTQDLEKRYPELLQPIIERNNQPLKVLKTLATLTPSIPSIPATGASRGNLNFNQLFDFVALLQVSRAISSTLNLEELLSLLSLNFMKNSGADKCALILCQDGEWQVRALSDLQRTVVQTAPLNGHPAVPYKLIQYAKNTLQSIAIDDLDTQIPNINDPYLNQYQPKSVLCFPFLNDDRLVGVLYLENRLARGVFSSERLLVLNFLCSQATVALENARLYRQVQQTFKDLQQMQFQWMQSEKMLALNNLAIGVDREINNPIGCIVGNFSIARDYIDELLRLIDLYCQTFPQPGTVIEEELHAIDLDYVREDLSQLIRAMEEESERIKIIGKSLRTFSIASCDVKQPFDVHEGLESSLLILRHRLKANEFRPAIEIFRDYGELPKIDCFPGQLNQVFMNLLANAIDALEEVNSGRSFDEIAANPNRIILRTRCEKDRVKITIANNGVSRSEATWSRLFNPLFAATYLGTGSGLGLALARAIVVEQHQGELLIRPLRPQGAEAIATLPIGTESYLN